MRLTPLVSVIIPTWNEAGRIERCLAQFRHQAGEWELIVADGGSEDGTAGRAEALGARVLRCPERGRGAQQNAGAAAASGDLLVFLHADAILPPDAHAWITATLMVPGTAAGAFRVRHEAETWRGWRTLLLRIADLRSRWTRAPYGDQALFMKAALFRACGGFPPRPLMEDVALARALACRGRIRTVPAEVRVSARRFEQGLLRAFLCMNTFPLLGRLGVAPHTLARLYGSPRERP